MKFTQVIEKSSKIKRKSWQGFWELVGEYNTTKIIIHCADGKTLEIRETDDILFTLMNVCADDWEVLND
jgi:hypothetical protein